MDNNRVIQNSIIKMVYNKIKLDVTVELAKSQKFDFEITLLNNHDKPNSMKGKTQHKFNGVKLFRMLQGMECFVIYKILDNKTIFFVKGK